MDIEIVLKFATTMTAYLGSGVIKKLYSKKLGDKTGSKYIYNSITSLVSAIVLCIWGGIGNVSLFTILLGCAFGVVTAIQQISNLKALDVGPLSYTSVIISLSTLIPTLSGLVFWNEQIGVRQIIGIALLAVCFVLSVEKKPGEEKMSVQWLLYSVIAFLCTGMIGVMQKFHQKSDFKGELNGFLIIAFVISFVYSVAMAIIATMKNKDKDKSIDFKAKSVYRLFAVVVVAGLCVAVNNKINLDLSGKIDSAIFFPIVNGGGLVLTMLCAVTFFREKLSPKQWIGFFTGIASVLLIAIK